MWWLICCFISLGHFSSNEINVESKSIAENSHGKNETQISLEPLIETSNRGLILIFNGGWTEPAADIDPNTEEGLEIRDNSRGCCSALYSSYRARRNWNPTLSPEHKPNPVTSFEPFPVEKDRDGNVIPPWHTEAWKSKMDAAYVPPSLSFQRKEKARKFLHTIEPLLHMCCCCCIAHWCD